MRSLQTFLIFVFTLLRPALAGRTAKVRRGSYNKISYTHRIDKNMLNCLRSRLVVTFVLKKHRGSNVVTDNLPTLS